MTTARIIDGAGWVNPKALPRGPNGRALCRYCGQEVPVGRRTFCSGERATFSPRALPHGDGAYVREGHGCVHEHCLRSDPGYARKCVYARDRGQCALCPNVNRGAWEADHTVPVVEGGGACGLGNLRTLCIPCHRLETAKLAARRATSRNVTRETEEEISAP